MVRSVYVPRMTGMILKAEQSYPAMADVPRMTGMIPADKVAKIARQYVPRMTGMILAPLRA